MPAVCASGNQSSSLSQFRSRRVTRREHGTGHSTPAGAVGCWSSSWPVGHRIIRPSGRAPSRPSPDGGAALTGAGATFPNPIYTKWFDAYSKQTGVRINYQSIGSGGGIRQFTEGTVDFGASDAPMTDEQMAAVKGNVLHVPTVLGAVVRHLQPAVVGPAAPRLDGATLADIFLGRITKWNDTRLVALNSGRDPPESGHHRGAPLGWVGHLVHLHRLPLQGLAGLEGARSAGRPRSSGRPAWAARATRG